MTTVAPRAAKLSKMPTSAPIAPAQAVVSGRLPRTGLVLIGSSATVRWLLGAVEALGEPITPAGCVLVAGERLGGNARLRVLGELDELAVLVRRYDLRLGLVCLPPSMGHARARVAELARHVGLELRTVPSFNELLARPSAAPDEHAQTPTTMSMAPPAIDLGALIGRTPHLLDRAAVAKVLTGKRVVITGAGGSIGSELAQVAASFAPSQLVLMERSENALFEIDRQIARRWTRVERKAVLHDVVDAEGTFRLLGELRPNVVFHSAAHKHVPLMEDHPAHAVTNNLFGTKAIADAAVAAGAEQIVMISSDKAVNPTSVMGATKRLAEMYLHGLGARLRDAARAKFGPDAPPATRVSMVRFGNVLGSNASVLTIWAQQVAEGGPVTITDPRMTRYFMTIPEAATLVIQSTTLPDPSARGVGVFVLDMGKPVAIAELAERFVRACGFSPGRTDRVSGPGGPSPGGSIEMVVTGIRPGEKLHEELAYAAESLQPTAHPGVLRWAGDGFADDLAGVIERTDQMVRDMASARFSTDRYQVLSLIRRHVPGMRPPAPIGDDTRHPVAG
jgi:FlaA1/EpsC-like NDP-sugar epimerase